MKSIPLCVCPGLLLAALAGFARPTAAQGATTPRAFQTPLFVAEDQGVARHGEPIASGIPFPEACVYDPAHIRVLDGTGTAVPCQAHQLGISWPDGSLE